jgi:hypothetical protein
MLACGDEPAPTPDPLDAGELPGGVNPPVMGECVAFNTELEGDFKPGTDDAFGACAADDGTYHPVDPSISSVARTQALEAITALLSTPTADPSPDDFLAARKLYDEDEGLGSRVARRYDPHYQPKADADCRDADSVRQNPDYCVGPAKLEPILRSALNAGYEGRDPRFNAGRVEGALYWFSAVSTYKETLTCAEENPKDCDSAYGYFDGAGLGIGLGGAMAEADLQAYARAARGALAISCFRELDPAVPAQNGALRDRARAQLDRAVLEGVIAVLLARIDAVAAAEGDAARFHWGFVTAFLGAVQSQTFRAEGAREPIDAARAAASPAEVDLTTLKDALTRIVRCDA